MASHITGVPIVCSVVWFVGYGHFPIGKVARVISHLRHVKGDLVVRHSRFRSNNEVKELSGWLGHTQHACDKKGKSCKVSLNEYNYNSCKIHLSFLQQNITWAKCFLMFGCAVGNTTDYISVKSKIKGTLPMATVCQDFELPCFILSHQCVDHNLYLIYDMDIQSESFTLCRTTWLRFADDD